MRHLFRKQCLVEALLKDLTTSSKCAQSLLADVTSKDSCEGTCEDTYEEGGVLRTCDEVKYSMLYKMLKIVSRFVYMVGEMK
jgi:hypothetical protein